MNEKRTLSGIVTRVQKLGENYGYLVVKPFNDSDPRPMKKIVYFSVDKKYEGKAVEIIDERSGFLGRKFKQTIRSDGLDKVVEMPYWIKKQIVGEASYYEMRVEEELSLG